MMGKNLAIWYMVSNMVFPWVITVLLWKCIHTNGSILKVGLIQLIYGIPFNFFNGQLYNKESSTT